MGEHVGLTIKKLREERKLSKARLAREAGFSDAYLVQIEKGDRTPSPTVLRSLAKALRVPAHRLLIPSGYYSENELSDAAEIVTKWIENAESELGRTLTDEERDRLFSRVLERVEETRAQTEYYEDPELRDEMHREYLREEKPLSLTPEDFWEWNETTSWAPEHWNALTSRDRKLVQQLINRLVELAE